MINRHRLSIPLFWMISPEERARMIQYQWDNYGILPEIPTPPDTSQAVWLNTWHGNLAEIDKIMRKAPSHQEKVK